MVHIKKKKRKSLKKKRQMMGHKKISPTVSLQIKQSDF